MMNKTKLYKAIVSNLKKEGANRIAIFGSYARNQETRNSDVDLIVKFPIKKSLLELVRIERELSENLGIKVELLTEKSISPLLIKNIIVSDICF